MLAADIAASANHFLSDYFYDKLKFLKLTYKMEVDPVRGCHYNAFATWCVWGPSHKNLLLQTIIIRYGTIRHF